MKILASL